MDIISIQSHVAYGHVGNSAAVFPLQRLGFNVWPIHTVQFSNHTGYGKWRGEIFPPSLISECIKGIEEQNALHNCGALLSGYMGDKNTGNAILDALETIRKYNPNALYCCDPVMGDVESGIFVQPGIPEMFMEKIIPHATIITPNHFELELLTGKTIMTEKDALNATKILHKQGPKIILITSFIRNKKNNNQIEMIVSDTHTAWILSKPKLPMKTELNGAGDVAAALFLGWILKGNPIPQALRSMASTLQAIFTQTYNANKRELQLIAAQESFIEAKDEFPASIRSIQL